MILEGKKEFHEKLNSIQRGKTELLMQTWEYAYRTHPNEAGQQYIKLLEICSKEHEQRTQKEHTAKAKLNSLESDEDYFEYESDGGTCENVTICRFNSTFNKGNSKGKIYVSRKPFKRVSNPKVFGNKGKFKKDFSKNQNPNRSNRRKFHRENFKSRIKNYKPTKGRFQVKSNANDKMFYAYSEEHFEELRNVVLSYVDELEKEEEIDDGMADETNVESGGDDPEEKMQMVDSGTLNLDLFKIGKKRFTFKISFIS